MDKTYKYLIATFGLLSDALSREDYIKDGRFNMNKAKQDTEYYTFWVSLKNLWQELQFQMGKIPKKKLLKLADEVDTNVKKMTDSDFDAGYIMLIVALKLGEYFNESNCPKHILLKAQLAKFSDLSTIAINALREQSDSDTIRTSLIIAKVIKDYIEDGKLINAEILIKNKPSWAKGKQ